MNNLESRAGVPRASTRAMGAELGESPKGIGQF